VIVIATPIHSFIYPATQLCINRAAKAHGMSIVEPEIGNSDIAAARTYLARKALSAGASGILWVDADMVFTVDDVAALLAGDADVRGTNYWTRDGEQPSWRPLEDGDVEMGSAGRVYQARYVGFGLTYTTMAALGIAAQTPPLLDGSPHWFKQLPEAQEDESFCTRVRGFRPDLLGDAKTMDVEAPMLSGSVTVNTRICPGHLQPNPVYWWSNSLLKQAPRGGVVKLINAT
jgi:hypothetical protein